MWRTGESCPKDGTPVFVRSAACASVAAYSDEWHGWVVHADGFDARDHRGDLVVIDRPEWWMPIPELEVQDL